MLDPTHMRLHESEDGLQQCGLCGAGATGDNPMSADKPRQFVVIAIPGREMVGHPDLVGTVDDRGDRVVVRHRDPKGRGPQAPVEPPEGHYYGSALSEAHAPDGLKPAGAYSPLTHNMVTTVLERPMVCGDCVARMASLIGYEDATVLTAQADELRAELERVTGERDRLDAEKTEAEDALKASRVFERLLPPSKGNSRAKAAA